MDGSELSPLLIKVHVDGIIEKQKEVMVDCGDRGDPTGLKIYYELQQVEILSR